jgi:hypothetical protein
MGTKIADPVPEAVGGGGYNIPTTGGVSAAAVGSLSPPTGGDEKAVIGGTARLTLPQATRASNNNGKIRFSMTEG